MKVLAISPDSFDKPIGGLGVQWGELYKRLYGRVDYYVSGYPLPYDLKNYYGVLNPMPEIQHGPISTILSNTSYLGVALRFPKPDIVHAMDWSVYLAGVYAADYYNVPLVVSMQLSQKGLTECGIFYCGDHNTSDGMWVHKTCLEIEKLGLNYAKKIIQVSNNYSQKYFKEYNHKNVVIPNGIDLNLWKPTNNFIFPGNNKYKVVYIGRFAMMKSVIQILESKIPDNIDLILIGDLNTADYPTQSKINEVLNSNPSNIFHIGSLYGQEKINALCSADAIIVPSRHEPFGIVGLEGLASKSIVLSSRIDGLGDFLNDSNSIDCGITSESITDALNQFLSLTETQKNELIQNGIETCKKYNWDEIADQYYNEYNKILFSI